MGSFSNFQSKNKKNTVNRYDIYEADFYTPINLDNPHSTKFQKNIDKWTEFVAYMRWCPDIYYDMIKPETGSITLDLDQRVMMRSLARFPYNYFCVPRGSSKTLINVMQLYHTAVWYPNITLSITASTKESAMSIWREKHDEILRFYPAMAAEIKNVSFRKDSGKVEFQNGAIIDNLANSQASKGLRRRRGSLEESALINKDVYDDAIEPIFNIPRRTLKGEVDATELNGAINRFTTSGKIIAPLRLIA